DALLRKAEPYSCSVAPGGGLAVATINNGALLLSGQGKLQRILNQSSGLPSDSVTFVYPDREGALWLAHVSGVSRVQAPAPLSFFDARTGLTGSVYAIARHGDSIYAGTTTGLYQLKSRGPGEFARFEPIKKFIVFSLLSTETELLVGSSEGV